ncbi:MAG: lipoyl synthase [Candidatus Margulisiibacteriota bacterium]
MFLNLENQTKTMSSTFNKKKINLKDIIAFRTEYNLNNLATICEQALCPNISECFKNKEASFLILGTVCTRPCKFCRVKKQEALAAPDPEEPARLAAAIKKLGLEYVVITSPTRDDLPDYGANQFAAAILAIRTSNPETKIEVLIPDFQANLTCLEKVVSTKPDIISHNLETVPRLYEIRKGADYFRSLKVLAEIKKINPEIITKTALLLGLGETESEVLSVFKDLLEINCKVVYLGQYLAPSKKHFAVQEYLSDAQFAEYKEIALSIGFDFVMAGQFVRSSYRGRAMLDFFDKYQKNQDTN